MDFWRIFVFVNIFLSICTKLLAFSCNHLEKHFSSDFNAILCKYSTDNLSGRCKVIMGDKIPKKRKKPKAIAATSSTPSSDSGARRVDPNLNVSMRKQIMLAKLLKAAEKGGSQSYRKQKTERQRYRRKKVDEEQIVPKKEEPVGPSLPTTCLIDGYNIIGAWPRLKKKMEKEMDLAREMLINDLVELKHNKNWHIIVVFDGYKRGGDLKVDTTGHGLEVVFTGAGYTADNYIETKTMNLGKEGCREILVATNDNMIRNAVLAHGGMILSASRIIQEMKAVKKSSEIIVKDLQQSFEYANRIERNLDEESLQVLQDIEDDVFLREFDEKALRHMPRAMKKLLIERKSAILEKRAMKQNKA